MNILFITASRIGDAVLSTGLLNYMAQKHPDAKVTIVCGPLCTSLFEGYPLAHEVIGLKKQKHNKHWISLWRRVVGQKWDIVVDLRNSAVSRLIRARKRYIFGPRIDKTRHKVEQASAVMQLDKVAEPKLWFSDAQTAKAKELIKEGKTKVIGVGPTANWIGKTWPPERFVDVIKMLTKKGSIYEGGRVAVFAAPGEEENALKVLAGIPKNKAIDLIAKTDPGTAAACLARCDFYLGNDSGLMHCAAAGGVKTFGVFGPSYPHLYAPWGTHTAYARTPETFDELIDFEGYSPQTCGCLMESLRVETVEQRLQEFLEF